MDQMIKLWDVQMMLWNSVVTKSYCGRLSNVMEEYLQYIKFKKQVIK